ncbi:hypothetical protein GTQ34_06645 [Muricauda sp. JGD-17]|uniref:Signal transduction histidine kinase internal region domain-containing protein n=1 Tax=Flagellimonas ochracea TaxID=2696472 RepID=A0A964TB44_9FLAO|nr:histidine kinase [Allomuricauda ochracea]NAY91590.1 hypothetical protein [Allomuricauda ochracea]
MKYSILFLILSFGLGIVCQANGQAEKSIPFEVIKNPKHFDSINKTPIEDGYKPTFFFSEKTIPDDEYWIRLDFSNAIPDSSFNNTLYLKMNSFDYGYLYYWNGTRISKKTIGHFEENSASKKIPFENYYSEVQIDIKNLIKKKYIYIKAKRITFNESIQNWNFSYSFTPAYSNYDLSDLRKLVHYYIFAGLCLVIWLSTLSFFFYLRKYEFLFYSFYILLLFFYVAGEILNINSYIFGENQLLQHWWSQGLIIPANIFYGFFFIYYLRTKQDYPKIHTLMYVIMGGLILTLTVIIVFYFSNYLNGLIYINTFFMKVVYALCVLGLFYLIFYPKNNLAYFVIFASFAFLISSLIHIYFADPNDGLLLNSRYYLLLGCVLEIIIFTVGLNYKVHLEFKENISLQQKALNEKNRALRAQINPHFIFNALNSLQNLIIKDNKVSSLKYLSNFSRLARSALESSIEPDATLQLEINMLKDYLELESLRFDSAFSYEIVCQKGLDTESIKIPFMICQPFAENAIIHGLLPKEDDNKKLIISFSLDENILTCRIDDNGIGRQAAKDNGSWHQRARKSRGIQVSKLRLDSSGLRANNYEIIDKKDSNGNSKGTTVIIKVTVSF